MTDLTVTGTGDMRSDISSDVYTLASTTTTGCAPPLLKTRGDQIRIGPNTKPTGRTIVTIRSPMAFSATPIFGILGSTGEIPAWASTPPKFMRLTVGPI